MLKGFQKTVYPLAAGGMSTGNSQQGEHNGGAFKGKNLSSHVIW